MEGHGQKSMRPYIKASFLCVLCLFLGTINAHASTYYNKVADAIYKAEGGKHARYAYGIKSVKYRGVGNAREICLRTIRHAHKDWVSGGCKGEFLTFLRDRYCPVRGNITANEKRLNVHWLKNVKKFMGA